MKKLLIKDCSDSFFWYRDKIGETVPYLCTYENEGMHMSVEDAGYKNIVLMKDSEIVEVNAES